MDIPIQGVHAVLPVTPRNAGNTQVFTIPRQYQEHKMILIILEEHATTETHTKEHEVTHNNTPQAPTKPIRPAPGVEWASDGGPKPPENNTKTPPRSTQRQEPTEETHPYSAPCGQRFLTPGGLQRHRDEGCIGCGESGG